MVFVTNKISESSFRRFSFFLNICKCFTNKKIFGRKFFRSAEDFFRNIDEFWNFYPKTFFFGRRFRCSVPTFSVRTNQRWIRAHKARGQGHKKISRPRTAFSRTGTIEAKGRNTRGQACSQKFAMGG